MNTVNTLADNAFKHRLTSVEEAQIIVLTPYSYSMIIESKYDDTKFKRLLIDSEATTRSIDEIDQLKALQKIENIVNLDVDTTESVTFIFEIDSTTSIETITLNTLMRSVTFHIILVNTLFLLCLIDINKLEAFFNNIINEIIQKKKN